MIQSPDEAQLHAYVDGRLGEPQQRRIQAWLDAHPDWAATVTAWKRDAELLRTAVAGAEPAPATAAFELQRLQRSLRVRRRQRVAAAASLALAGLLGGALGWSAREAALPAFVPMEDAVQAHRLFAAETSPAPSLDAAQAAALQSWLAGHFGRYARLADPQVAGFRLVGAQQLATEGGAAALLLYRDDGGARISLYMRPRSRLSNPERRQRREGELLAQYWVRGDYGFAVVSAADEPRARDLQQHFAAPL